MTTMALPRQLQSTQPFVLYCMVLAILLIENVTSFVIPTAGFVGRCSTTQSRVLPFVPVTTTTTTFASKTINSDVDDTTAAAVSFIDTELRDAAMKLHTRVQAPGEGKLTVQRVAKPYVTTHADYLAFLVDSQHVYEALEAAVDADPSLVQFRETGLERTQALATDITFVSNEYGESRPEVSKVGLDYAQLVKTLADDNKIPEFMCHYYNYYFAHTAGGMMIGKRMSELLLNGKTLEFYKWDGDIVEIKAKVKSNIEELVSTWSTEERKRCVKATGAMFKGGAGINGNLRGGKRK